MFQDLHTSLEGKVQTSHRLIDKLDSRAKSIQQHLESTKDSLMQLENAYREKNLPMKLCLWRMEQRQKRPLREHVRDQVGCALEDEHASLSEMQKKLQEAIAVTKQMITVLEDKAEELKGDVETKMQALTVDELCLRTAHKSWHASAGSRSGCSSAAVTPRRTGTSMHTEVSCRNEVRRQQEARQNDQAARRREEAAAELCKDNELLVQRSQKATKDGLAKTEKCLQDSVAQDKLMRKRLENELRSTQQKVDNSQSKISETQSQITAIQEPISLCSTQAAWRKQRADREQIMDPVEMHLESQKQKLMRATEDLRNHRLSEKSNLTQLGEQLERLREDLRDKSTSLSIDTSCLSPPKELQSAVPKIGMQAWVRNKTTAEDILFNAMTGSSRGRTPRSMVSTGLSRRPCSAVSTPNKGATPRVASTTPNKVLPSLAVVS
jgi:chromosome segregation ATPase